MPRTPSNVPLGNRAPGFAGGFLRFCVPTRFGSILSGFFQNQQNSQISPLPLTKSNIYDKFNSNSRIRFTWGKENEKR